MSLVAYSTAKASNYSSQKVMTHCLRQKHTQVCSFANSWYNAMGYPQSSVIFEWKKPLSLHDCAVRFKMYSKND